MFKEKVIVFMDYANIDRSARDSGYDVDYQDLLEYFGQGRFLVDVHCYVPIDPHCPHRLDNQLEYLSSVGYLVHTKQGKVAGDTYKCNFDIEITMDILRTVYNVKPDIILLASGDIDFIPVVEEIRKNGIRVEVAAFQSSISKDLTLKASGFINLDVYYQDYIDANSTESNITDDVEADSSSIE